MLKLREGGHADLTRFYTLFEVDFDSEELISKLSLHKGLMNGSVELLVMYDDESQLETAYALCFVKGMYDYVLLKSDGVERGGRLVQNEYARVFQEHAGNGYALLFASGKLTGEVVHTVLKAHFAHGSSCVQRIPAYLRCQFYVFQCGEVLHQIIELKHKTHVIAAVSGELL